MTPPAPLCVFARTHPRTYESPHPIPFFLLMGRQHILHNALKCDIIGYLIKYNIIIYII